MINGVLLDKEGNLTEDNSWYFKISREEEQKIYRLVNSQFTAGISKSLVINMDKAMGGHHELHKEKLIKKQIQVRGKNGKIFSRLQWVDPNTGLPPSKSPKQEEEPTEKHSNKESKPDLYNDVPQGITKKKVYDLNTQEGFIDKQLDKMKRAEKEEYIGKYRIKWKHNDFSAIDWKNAVVSLKKFMHDNPAILGAETLPKEGAIPKTLTGTDKVNDFCNKLDDKGKYELMRKFNIFDGEDPRIADPKKGPMVHLKYMQQLKKYLLANPEFMEDTKLPVIAGAEPTGTVLSPAQKGGNTIEGVMASMTSEQLYNIMRDYHIAENDPRSKEATEDTAGDQQHLKNMTALKALISKHPEVLTVTRDGMMKEVEKKRLDGRDKKHKERDEYQQITDRMSKMTKLKMIALLKSKHAKEFDYVETSTDPKIMLMHSVVAMQHTLENHPKVRATIEAYVNKNNLLDYHLTVKNVESLLRNVAGISSNDIDYATVDPDKKHRWLFGIESSCEIKIGTSGKPAFLIHDTGYDGDKDNNYEYPMSEIKAYMEDTNAVKGKVQPTILPLEKQDIADIEKALNRSFDEKFEGVIKDRVLDGIRDNWFSPKCKMSNSIQDLSYASAHLSMDSVKKVMRDMEVPVDDNTGTFDIHSEPWKAFAYKNMITDKKINSAENYLVPYGDSGKYETYPLVESAKKWTSEEKSKARVEVLTARLFTPDFVLDDSEKGKANTKKLNRLATQMKKSLDYVPFDLYTDVFGEGGMTFHLQDRRGAYTSMDMSGNIYIVMGNEYMKTNTLAYPTPLMVMPKYAHPLSDVMAHEFAHAIDKYFCGNEAGKANEWNTSQGDKYVEAKHKNCVKDSYDTCVQRSNPNQEVFTITHPDGEGKDVNYYFHKDEWINTYEGRIYNKAEKDFSTDATTGIMKETGKAKDPFKAVEHWSENVSRFSSAFHAYSLWKSQTPKIPKTPKIAKESKKDSKGWLSGGKPSDKQLPMLDTKAPEPQDRSKVSMGAWAKQMSEDYGKLGFSDDWASEQDSSKRSLTGGAEGEGRSYINRDKHPVEAAGYQFNTMQTRYPKLTASIKSIFDRGDFIGKKGGTLSDAAKTGNTYRKSEQMLVIGGGK